MLERLMLFFLALLAAVACPEREGLAGAGASPPQSLEALAGAIPPNLIELVSGGSWHHEGVDGVYRVLVLQDGPSDKPHATVYAQWLGERSDTGALEHIVTVPIAEFNALASADASVALDGERVNDAGLEIAWTDPPTGRERRLLVRLAEPGVYKVDPQSPAQVPAPAPTQAPGPAPPSVNR